MDPMAPSDIMWPKNLGGRPPTQPAIYRTKRDAAEPRNSSKKNHSLVLQISGCLSLSYDKIKSLKCAPKIASIRRCQQTPKLNNSSSTVSVSVFEAAGIRIQDNWLRALYQLFPRVRMVHGEQYLHLRFDLFASRSVSKKS